MTTAETIQLIAAIGFGGFISSMVTLYINTSNARHVREFEEKKDAYMAFLGAYQAIEFEGFTEPKTPALQFRDLLGAMDRVILVGPPHIVKAAVSVTRLTSECFKPGSDERAKGEQNDKLGAAYNALRNAMRHDLGINVEPLALD